jgi:hypothetical protein
VLKVDRSPDGQRAIVFLEYNPDSACPELYEVLCEKAGEEWSSSVGSSGGSGLSWKLTHEDGAGGELGVTTRWDPPRAEWDTSPPKFPSEPQ